MDIDSAAPSPAAAAAQQPQQQQGRVHVRELTTAKAFAGGLVTGLACSGPCLVATESLGSVTVLRALTTPGGRVQLLPVGADRHGLMAVDVALPVAPNCAAVGRTEEAAVQQAAAAGVQPAHESLLVATHPTGLLLLQRDLAAEAQHLAGAHQATVAAWEAGGAARQAVLFGQAADAQLLWLQQQEQLQAVQPLLWLGQGEAAPWAAAGGPGAPGAAAAARPDGGPHHAAAAGGANRAGLAAAAAAAGGLAAPAAARPVTTGREVGVYNPGADMAPRLMSSAACAPAPGISLMATAQLGLHVQQLDRGAAGCSNGSSSGGAEPAVASSLPVWCFSASGAVSVAQMLQPQQARALLQLQKRLLEQQHGQGSQASQLLQLQLQPATEQQQGRGKVLRALAKLPAKASFRNFQRSLPRTAEEEEEEELGFNCVDGDLLFGADAEAVGAAPSVAVEQDGRLLQYTLWQLML